MLIKTQSTVDDQTNMYDNVLTFHVDTIRHKKDCECNSCERATKYWNFNQNAGENGWLIYHTSFEYADGSIHGKDFIPGDDIYFLNNQGRIIDKWHVPVD